MRSNESALSHNISLAVIAPQQPGEFFELLWQGIQSAAAELSVLGVNILAIATPQHDAEREQQILSELLEQDVSAIAIIPAHATSLNSLIDQHVLRGRPVVTFNSDAPESRRTLFVGPEPVQAGHLAGELLSKFMHGRGRLACFPGALQNDHIAKRYRGLKEHLERHAPDVQLVACQTGTNGLEETARRIFVECTDLEGIYVGTASVFQVAAAMEASGLRVPCVGFDHTLAVQPFLLRGTVSAIIDQSRQQQGYFAVQKAYKLAATQGVDDASSVQIPSTVILGSHVDGQSGSASLSDAFEKLVQQRTAELQAYKERLERANAELLKRVETDPLTGLLNHRKFQETLNAEVARAKRGSMVSLLMLDIDSFKLLNDTYGHPAGDTGLRAVADVLRNCCRTTDYCARYGGDEFGVILPAAERSHALRVRERILEQMSSVIVLAGDRDLPLRVSVGVATFPDEATSAAELVVVADNDMYRAKNGVPAMPGTHYARIPDSYAGSRVLTDLMRSVDKKDQYTGEHSRLVARYAAELGQKLNLSRAQLATLQMAALLHDLGKISIPETILRKTGRLTEQEYEIVKQNPVYGKILLTAASQPEDLVRSVAHHLERWDGTGYPDGLRGEAIPLLARILMVSDAYSAMRLKRPYRSALSKAEATRQLREGAGTQFDPRMINALLEILEKEGQDCVGEAPKLSVAG